MPLHLARRSRRWGATVAVLATVAGLACNRPDEPVFGVLVLRAGETCPDDRANVTIDGTARGNWYFSSGIELHSWQLAPGVHRVRVTLEKSPLVWDGEAHVTGHYDLACR
jgi:hypothetical protein